MNLMRDRLVYLMGEAVNKCKTRIVETGCRGCEEYVKGENCIDNIIADHLIENGVIVPPCKVWNTVYSPRENDILEQTVVSIEIEEDPHVRVYFTCDHLCDGCPNNQPYQNQAGEGGCFGEYGESFFAFEDFGKTVFITREEAEYALKERCRKND